MVRINKVLNNNAVIITEIDGTDAVWIGGGLGFQKKVGDLAESKRIEKVFVIEEKQLSDELSRLLDNISTDYLELAVDIIDYAKTQLKEKLSDSLYLSLTDHLANAFHLHNEGLVSGGELAWEVKKLYPTEFQVGKHALMIILDKTGKQLSESEAGNIALHFINAQTSITGAEAEIISQKIRDILTLISMYNAKQIDETSLSYDRFVTHLRFFFKRLDGRVAEYHPNPLLEQVQTRYTKAFETMKLVENYLQLALNEDEQLYLCLHIQKLIAAT